MGNSRAVGTLWQSTHNLSQAEYEEVCRLIEATGKNYAVVFKSDQVKSIKRSRIYPTPLIVKLLMTVMLPHRHLPVQEQKHSCLYPLHR